VLPATDQAPSAGRLTAGIQALPQLVCWLTAMSHVQEEEEEEDLA